INIIPVLLLIHISAFYLQFAVYLISGYYIDLLEFFTGEKSRYISFTTSLSGIGTIRPTGFHIEPSTYFTVILSLVSILLIHRGIRKNFIIVSVSILSMYLSFSTAAFIITTLLVLHIIFKYKLIIKIYPFLVLFLFAIIFYFT